MESIQDLIDVSMLIYLSDVLINFVLRLIIHVIYINIAQLDLELAAKGLCYFFIFNSPRGTISNLTYQIIF